MQNPGKLIDEEGHQFHVSVDTCTCKLVVVSRPHTLPMSDWYDFHWHHLLRNRCMKPSVVTMQKTVPLCFTYIKCTTFVLASYPLVTQCVGASSWWQLFCNTPSILIQSSTTKSHRAVQSSLHLPLRTAQICHRYWTDYHWLTIRISLDDTVICCSGE